MHSVAVERRTLLQGVINVVAYAYVLSEELFAHALVQAGTLVLQRGGGKIVKKKSNEIEHGCGFEDYGIRPRRKFARVDGKMRPPASAPGPLLRPPRLRTRRASLGPTRPSFFPPGARKLRARLPLHPTQPAG